MAEMVKVMSLGAVFLFWTEPAAFVIMSHEVFSGGDSMEQSKTKAVFLRLWAAAGLVCLLTALLSCGSLQRGTWYGKLTVAALMALWAALGVFLLARAKLSRDAFLFCLLPLGLAALLRVVSLDHATYDYQDFLAPWTEFFRQYGGMGAVKHPVGNYNVPYLYFLAAISYLDVPDLYLIKLFSVFFDLLLAYAGMRIAGWIGGGERGGTAVFGAVIVLPTVVLNGSCWGQCDSIYAALCLLAVADTLEEKPARGVVLLALGFSFKLQAIFLIPLWCVFWFSGRVKFRHLLLFPLTYFATCLPALALGKPLGDILSVYVSQTSYYSALTMNAPSLYTLIPYGKEVNETLLARLGILAAFALLVGELVWLFLRRKKLKDDQLVLAGLLMSLFIPLFLPHMHERYFMLAEVLSVICTGKSLRRAPIAAAVQIAALGGYHAYLLLRYAFPMAWGAYLLLGAAAATAVVLGCSFHPKAQIKKAGTL